jgi:hypothetical protein
VIDKDPDVRIDPVFVLGKVEPIRVSVWPLKFDLITRKIN